MTNPVIKMGFILVLEISRIISSASTLCMGYVPHVLIFFHYFVTAWAKEPIITVVDTLSHSIDNVSFPAITICPRSFNSDRWGATIKTLDYMKRRCPSKG